MSLVDDFISKLDTKAQWQALKVVETLNEIFSILNTKGYLRDTLRANVERTNFVNIMKDSNKLFAAYNMLFHVFERKGMSKKFVEHNEPFGFYEDGLAYLFSLRVENNEETLRIWLLVKYDTWSTLRTT